MGTERAGSETQGSGRRTRRRHSAQYKLQVVRESLKPGVSTREVAQRHGLHESLIGVWRRRYSQSRLQPSQPGRVEAKLLPVRVGLGGTKCAEAAESSSAARIPGGGGAMHIEFSHGHRLSVRGEVDTGALSAVIRELSRA
jgi:transposase-like protein